MTKKELIEIANKYNKLETDLERLHFLKKHNGVLKVVLDNDLSMVVFDDNKLNGYEIPEDVEFATFDEYHGWGDGVQLLFEFAGITAEAC